MTNENAVPEELVALRLERKTGNEVFKENGCPIGRTLSNYWQWSASDLLGNTERGRLAEYIVANALDVADGVRSSWEAYDLETRTGIRVEVKASAYVQTWKQKNHSKIVFGIRPTRAWDPITNVFSTDCQRQAQVYVFALLAERNPGSIDPLNLTQWLFYVLPTSLLNEKAQNQKTISLSSLLRLGATKAVYRELRNAIESASVTIAAECN